jgi:hypothetical protein
MIQKQAHLQEDAPALYFFLTLGWQLYKIRPLIFGDCNTLLTVYNLYLFNWLFISCVWRDQ